MAIIEFFSSGIVLDSFPLWIIVVADPEALGFSLDEFYNVKFIGPHKTCGFNLYEIYNVKSSYISFMLL